MFYQFCFSQSENTSVFGKAAIPPTPNTNMVTFQLSALIKHGGKNKSIGDLPILLNNGQLQFKLISCLWVYTRDLKME